jgi:hypothetical protein
VSENEESNPVHEKQNRKLDSRRLKPEICEMQIRRENQNHDDL